MRSRAMGNHNSPARNTFAAVTGAGAGAIAMREATKKIGGRRKKIKTGVRKNGRGRVVERN